jgi:hypothetical protein
MTMREESLIPHEIEKESVFPEAAAFLGTEHQDKTLLFVKLLKECLPNAKTEKEVVGMEVRAAFEAEGTEVSEEVAHIVTDALLASGEMKEQALMVAHRIMKELSH